jgi:hypothetical protein
MYQGGKNMQSAQAIKQTQEIRQIAVCCAFQVICVDDVFKIIKLIKLIYYCYTFLSLFCVFLLVYFSESSESEWMLLSVFYKFKGYALGPLGQALQKS